MFLCNINDLIKCVCIFVFFIVLFGKIIMKIMFCVIKNIKIINVIGVILLIIYSDDFFNIVLIRFLIL